MKIKHPSPHRRNLGIYLLPCTIYCASLFATSAISAPVVTNVFAAQRPSTDAHPKWVDISYTLSDATFSNVNIYILVSQDSGVTWTVPATTFTGDYGTNVVAGATPTSKSVIWDAGADWSGHFTTNCRVRVLANDLGLVLIPPGSYNRGDASSDGLSDAPVYSVYVSGFYMDSTLVTGGKWSLVVTGYATGHGYAFDNPGSSKAPSHPVQMINWFDAVKWCNARSELEGATPVYYTDSGYTNVYRSGQVAPYVKPGANGYRLPTEAEWEKAARGGVSGKRFPWGNTISETQANYNGNTSLGYDLGPNGYNSTYAVPPTPYTSPVGQFAPNGYNLSDMAGNVFEWCWDWYGSTYYAAGQTDPQGPSSGSYRVLRAGSWFDTASYARCAYRLIGAYASSYDRVGFRCAKGL